MPTTPSAFDVTTVDLNNIIDDRAGIQARIPHRGHMLHLDAVVYMDRVNHNLVAYKDVRADEFWTAGHFPNFPLLPGVLQCEAAAQLLAYYASVTQVFSDALAALGGIENARFRGPVKPGDRLVIVCLALKIDRRMTKFHAQGYVQNNLVFECDLIGVPLRNASISSSSRPA